MPERRTPVQLVAHKLRPKDPMRNLIRERANASLSDSTPSELLRQFDDDATSWPPLQLPIPSFPPQYPRDPGPFTDVQLLRRVFISGQNKELEWVGDGLVGLAAADSLHRHVPDRNRRLTDDVLHLLCGKNLLGHLALLFGLQMHSPLRASERTRAPAAVRMSDVFEAYVGAVAIEFGCDWALDWLAGLFDPWVTNLCGSGRGVGNGDVKPVSQAEFDKYMESADGSPPAISPPYWPGPNLVAIAAFGPARVGLLAAKQNNARGLLESVPADWPPFDFSGVVLPTDYPPLPPVFLDADASILTAALTDVSCRIQFGSAVQFDQRYKWLGYQLCRAALAVLATQTLPSTASADLDAIRTECQAQSVFARLGLLFGLDKYVYRIRRADDSSAVGLALVAGSFRSLVAAVYVQFGWKRLLSWLEPLFNPWIRAAADGRLQESIGAKSQRRARRLDQQESQEATKRKKQKALQQLRLPDAGTTGVQRGAVTAARDTYRANPPVPRHGLIRHHPKPPRVHT